jgi:anti-anti-sigma factor
MQTRRFETEVRELAGVVSIALHGQIDVHADDAMQQAYAQAAGLDGQVLVLDFSDVDYINSTGIALIVRLLADARASGRQLRAFGLSRHYREIFEITRLSDFIGIYADEAAALAGGGDNDTSAGGPSDATGGRP